MDNAERASLPKVQGAQLVHMHEEAGGRGRLHKRAGGRAAEDPELANVFEEACICGTQVTRPNSFIASNDRSLKESERERAAYNIDTYIVPPHLLHVFLEAGVHAREAGRQKQE